MWDERENENTNETFNETRQKTVLAQTDSEREEGRLRGVELSK